MAGHDELDTSNDFAVGVLGGQIAVLFPPRKPMTKQRALMFAAYLVVLAEENDGEFEAALNAVKST